MALSVCGYSSALASTRPTIAGLKTVLVIRDKKQTLERFAQNLPAGVKIVSSFDDLVLLEGMTSESTKDLKKRLHARFIKQGQNVSSPITALSARHRSNQALDVPPRQETSHRSLAALTDRCPDGRSRLWAQESLDAPLFETALSLIDPKIQAQSARVAVLDSGFDATQADAFSAIGGVQPRDGVLAGDRRPVGSVSWPTDSSKDPSTPITGRPGFDPGGHGTMVVSTIAANDGLGIAKNIELSLYRITPEGDGGSTSSVYIDIALWRACQEMRDPAGLTLINLSWGGRLDEQQVEDAEDLKLDQEMERRLAEAGCLVFKAAGNDNFRNARRDEKLDDATLRVAATDLTRKLSSFSTRGEVSAPGSDVWVVQSAQTKVSDRASSKCEAFTHPSRPRRFINGTSFAAPFMTAVASQVVRALKAGDQFATLSTRDRIKLVNRILKASTLSGSVNLVRAVQIASEWNKNPIPGSPDELEALLSANPNPSCKEEKPVRCSRLTDPILVKSCVLQSRLRVATCPSVDPSVLEDLAITAFKEAEIELGLKAADLFAEHSNNNKAKRSILKSGIDQFVARTGKNDYKIAPVLTPNLLRALIIPYLEACTLERNCDGELSLVLVRAALLSRSIAFSLSEGVDTETGEDRGSRDTEKAMSRLFELSLKTISLDGALQVLKMLQRASFGDTPSPEEILKENSEDQNYFSRTQIPRLAPSVVVRLLDAFIRVTKPGSAISVVSQRMEARVLEEMAKRNDYFLGKTEKFVLYVEQMPERGSFDATLERNRTRIDLALESGQWQALAPIEMHYALRNPQGYPKWKEAYLKMLIEASELALQGRGWGAQNDNEIVMLALEECFAPRSKLSPSDQATLLESLRSALLKARNSDVLLELEYAERLNLSIGQTATEGLFSSYKERAEAEKNGLTFKSHPLLSPSLMAHVRLRLAAGVLSSRGRHRKFNRIRFQDLIERLAIDHAKATPIQSSSDASVLPLTAFEGSPPSRLPDPKRPSGTALELTHESRAEILDSLAERLIVESFEQTPKGLRLGVDSDRRYLFYQTGRWFRDEEDRTRFYLGFNPQGKWRKAAQKIIDTLRGSYGDYSTSDAVYALRSMIERVEKVHQSKTGCVDCGI